MSSFSQVIVDGVIGVLNARSRDPYIRSHETDFFVEIVRRSERVVQNFPVAGERIPLANSMYTPHIAAVSGSYEVNVLNQYV